MAKFELRVAGNNLNEKVGKAHRLATSLLRDVNAIQFHQAFILIVALILPRYSPFAYIIIIAVGGSAGNSPSRPAFSLKF